MSCFSLHTWFASSLLRYIPPPFHIFILHIASSIHHSLLFCSFILLFYAFYCHFSLITPFLLLYLFSTLLSSPSFPLLFSIPSSSSLPLFSIPPLSFPHLPFLFPSSPSPSLISPSSSLPPPSLPSSPLPSPFLPSPSPPLPSSSSSPFVVLALSLFSHFPLPYALVSLIHHACCLLCTRQTYPLSPWYCLWVCL